MDPLSVTASIVAILQLTVKVGEGLRDTKDASTDRTQFETDIRYSSNLLVALLSRIDESSDDSWHVRARELGAKGGPIYEYRVALELLRNKISTGHGMKKIGKAFLWKYIKDDAKHILMAIERLKTFAQIVLEIDHFELSKAIERGVSSLQEYNSIIGLGVGAIQHDTGRQRHHLMMNWLSLADFSSQHANFIAQRQADTGMWFLNCPEFTTWLQGTRQTLFCHGIPGAGKTMMAAIAVDHLQNKIESSDVGVAYLYCDYRSQAYQSTSYLLAAILKQLVQDRPSIAQPLSSLYDHHQVRGTKISLHEALVTLKTVLAHFSKVYVVIDALDECQNRDGTRDELLEFCQDFREQTDLHLMVTSRYIHDIVDDFKSMPQLEVRASNADVRQYVTGKVKQLAKCVQRDDDLRELVQNKISEAADGMFLLAHLHIEMLFDKDTKAKVTYALENLSKGSEPLNDAYKEVILRIDSQPQGHRTLAKNALSWVSHAQRPLTTRELCHALATKVGDKELDLDDIPNIRDIVSVCAGLITVDEVSQAVRLVHYTTQDFLVSIREKWNSDAQYDIASTCLTYICFNTFTSGSCTSDMEFENRLQQYEFLGYSARYWGQHAAAVQERICELALVLLQKSELIACVTQSRARTLYLFRREGYSQEFPKNVTGLHVAASFGLSHICKELLLSNQGENLLLADTRDSEGQTPLICATKNGHEAAVMLLLSMDEVDSNARDNLGRTPLIWAARNGHKDTVEQLLFSTNNADPNVKDDDGWTPLISAAYSGSKDVVEMLLHIDGVDVTATCRDGRTPLMFAAEFGHHDIVDLLLGPTKVGTDDYCLALDAALENGHEDSVELLLSTDKVNLNAKGNEGFTPLIWGVQHEEDEFIVRLLLSNDRVDPNVKSNDGITPLMCAVLNGSKEVVKLLLSNHKVDPDARSILGLTPLMCALYSGYDDIVELLLRTDKVDPNVKSNDGITPLMCAVLHESKEVVELLLSTVGVDPNAKFEDTMTALMCAVHKGSEDLVKLLLNTGRIGSDTDNIEQWISLELAVRQGYEGIVKLLLRTIDVDKEAERMSELRKLAAAEEQKAMVELLESYFIDS